MKNFMKNFKQQYKEQLIKSLEQYEVTPDPLYATGKPKRYYPNLCFKKAVDYVLDKADVPGVKLVHGLYTEVHFKHAWVELPNDIVFDGVLQRFYQKDGYYKARQAIKVVEYTPQEAARNMLEYSTCGGDWDDYILDKAMQKIFREKMVVQAY